MAKDLEAITNLLKGEEIPVNNNTEIEHFYTGSIFITGGTGFIGKVLTEKLLRACQNIDKIYWLVRSKKGESISKRIEKILDCKLFENIFAEHPERKSKVIEINGDITLPNLGISPDDEKILTENVTVIFHSAATVRFDEKLSLAVAINVKGTREIIKLASKCKNLKSIVHVSTAYSHCYQKDIDEKFYDCDIKYDELIQAVDTKTEAEIAKLTQTLLKKYPNTYCVTKAVAEDLVRNEAQHLPISIFRPAVVMPSYREPIRSWVDSIFGPTLGLYFVSTGLFHVWFCNDEYKVHNVPVDYVANAMIAIGYETSKNFQVQNDSEREIKIYNYTGEKNTLKWKDVLHLSTKYGKLYPTRFVIWYCYLLTTSSKICFHLLTFVLHTVPACLFDAFVWMTGAKKIRNRTLLRYYGGYHKSVETAGYFSVREWNFSEKNTEALWHKLSSDEQNLFTFDMKTVDWDRAFQTVVLGVRVYLARDRIETLPYARRKWKRLYYLHNATKLMLLFATFTILWLILQNVLGKF